MSMASVHGIVARMKTVPAGAFKQTCLRLLDEVGISGEPILITKRGKAVAQLMPVAREHGEDWSGALADRGSIHGDLPPQSREVGQRLSGRLCPTTAYLGISVWFALLRATSCPI